MKSRQFVNHYHLNQPFYRQRVQRLVHWLVVMALVLPALLPLQPAAAQSTATNGVDYVEDRYNQLSATLQADHAPAPGEVATLTFQITPRYDAPELQVEWILEGGAELLGDKQERFVAVGAQQRVQSVRQLRLPSEGVYRVNAIAHYQPAGGMAAKVLAVLFFSSKNGGGSFVADRNPTTLNPRHTIMPTVIETPVGSEADAAQAASPDHELCFSISGMVRRVERTPTQTGYADDVLVPVRNAPVELLDEDLIWDDSYGTTKTDANGNYSFPTFCRDSWFEEALDLYIEVTAERYIADERIVYVVDDTYIDEPYVFKSSVITDLEGGTRTISPNLTERSSAVFNIIDAAFDARRFWEVSGGAADGSKEFEYETEIYWNPDDDEDGSYYEPVSGEITIADDESSPDEWDDPVIMHEWAHMADDKYSCDDNPGGTHFVDQVVDDAELAWGEGYPDYYQSAVRASLGITDSNFYLDHFGLDVLGPGIAEDLETWDMVRPTLVSELAEFAVAAMLWDLRDGNNDGSDTVQHGHDLIQEVYTRDTFTSNGTFDDTCEVSQYLQAWRDLEKPTDGATAATITQNIGGDNPFAAVFASGNGAEQVTASGLLAGAVKPVDYQWWQQVVMVADRSKSMEGAKFNAVKSVLTEKVNDMATSPKGVAFSVETFDNTSAVNQTVVDNKFFANQVTPAINALTTNSAADAACPVQALQAMTGAVDDRMKGELWLFTDGDPTQANVENLVQLLNRQQLKGSIALLGGCPAVPVNPQNTTGATKNYLGLAADASQSGGIIPYILTALGSGGQFLFVDPSKISDAAEILRAQLSHSAGAGRWSDYVSDTATYRYDKLTSWEYQWIDTSTAAGGTLQGTPNPQMTVNLPKPFPFYGFTQDKAHVSRYGYLTFGPTPQADQAVNTPLPSVSAPNFALYPLWADLYWRDTPNVVAAGADGVNAPMALEAYVFTRQNGDWFVIETNGFSSVDGQTRAYQVLLNTITGEIRYQYKTLTTEAAIATIGLENGTGTSAVQIGHKDSSAAGSNMGYKFLPAPVQPSKSFTVAVDSLMNSVGFLLTGFSGDFAPMVVRTPDGAVVSCADSANVRCLTIGVVQYVQVKVNGRAGNWLATVSAGPSGAGTFSFSSIGASTVNASSPSNRARPTSAQPIAVNLAISTTGNSVDGWWQRPNGSRMGSPFKLYDDGAHNDGRAGDGEFGSDAVAPTEAGVAYLWIKGNQNSVDFVRNDPAPFNFQPLEVTSLGDGINLGGTTTLLFTIKNSDSFNHCYDRTTQVPDGWVYDWKLSQNEQNLGLCITAGATVTRSLDVRMSNAPTNDFPSGTRGQVSVFFVEKEAGQISGGASAEVVRYRPAAAIHFNESASAGYLRPNNSDTQPLAVLVVDAQGKNVADGTVVQFSSTLGSVIPTSGVTQDGQVSLQLKAGTTTGAAIVTAMIDAIVATTTVQIQNPLPNDFKIVAAQSSLPSGVETTVISATVRDGWGNPLPNQLVRIGVAEDGFAGAMNGSEVMTGTTNASGVLTAVYSRTPLPPPAGAASQPSAPSAQRTAIIRAEVLMPENGSYRVIMEDSIAITVLDGDSNGQQRLFLPLVQR